MANSRTGFFVFILALMFCFSAGAEVTSSGTNSLIVVFKPGYSPESYTGKKKSTQSSSKFRQLSPKKDLSSKKSMSAKGAKARTNLENMYELRLGSPEECAEAMLELSESPEVLYVEPNLPIAMQAAPSDPLYVYQYGLENSGQSFPNSSGAMVSGTAGADMKWRSVWDAGLPSNQVLVAVIDSGVDYNHDDLAGQMWTNPGEIPGNGIDDDLNGYIDDVYGWNTEAASAAVLDDHGHGTHVAGTIAAAGNNGEGVIGVNPNARIMAVKIFDETGSGSSANGIEAIIYAVDNGAKILNNSWGGYGYLQSLADAVLYANEQGAVVVCAAGNSDTSMTMYPAGYPGSVSIAATDANDDRATFSNYGSSVDLAAPGVSILSLRSSMGTMTSTGVFSNDYLVASGTSMATPHASGAFALLYAKYPGLDPWLYQRVMQASSDTNIYSRTANLSYAGQLGSGRVDINSAMNYTSTGVFVTARAVALTSNGFRPFTGSTNALLVRVGTWLSAASNVTIQAVPQSTNISLSTTSLNVGTVSSQTVQEYDSTFVLSISSNATPGSVESVVFNAYINGVFSDSYTMRFQLYRGAVNGFITTKPDSNGQRRVLSWSDSTLSLRDLSGSEIWNVLVPGSYTAVKGAAMGDLNGDGDDDIVFWYDYLTGGAAYFTAIDSNTNTLWSKYVGYNVQRGLTADINGDGRSDLIAMYKDTATTGKVRAYSGSGTTFWTYDMGTVGTSMSLLNIGEVNGDGVLDVIVGTADGKIQVINSKDGSVQTTISLDGYSFRYWSEARLADLDGDGVEEILALCVDEDGVGYLAAVNGNGTVRDGWPQYARPNLSGFGTSDVQLADMDGDGSVEIFLTDESTARLAGWDASGRTLFNFPVMDTNIVSRTQIADVNGDGRPDFVYLANYRVPEEGMIAYDLMARDADGLILHGYPVTYTELGEETALTDFTELEVGPMIFSGDTTNVFILSSAQGSLNVRDTGYPVDPSTLHWLSRRGDRYMTGRYVWPGTSLRAGFRSTNGNAGIGSFSAVYHATVSGNTNGVFYIWDFNRDGTPDATGSDLATVTNTYGAVGTYSVGLTVTNLAGETVHTVHTNYVRVLTGLGADFISNTQTAAAPIRIRFTDVSSPEPQYWLWSFGDGSTSTERDPAHLYTTTGVYTVSLTVSNTFSGSSSSDSITRTGYIHITGEVSPTNIYVAVSGSHSYPFKTWEEAATNIAEAVSAAVSGQVIHVESGVWDTGGELYLQGGVMMISEKGSDVTVLNGNGEERVLRMGGVGCYVDGFTIQNGFGVSGAGVLMDGGTLKNCRIANNISQVNFIGHAAAVAMENTDGNDPNMLVDSCVIESNRSTSIGALTIASSINFMSDNESTMVKNTIIRNNISDASTVWMLGRNAVLRNCLLYGNTSLGRATIETESVGNHKAKIENCTVVDNTFSSVSTNAAVVIEHTNDWMSNTLIYDNSGKGVSAVSNRVNGYNNLIQSPPAGFVSTGLITTAPTWVNRTAHDYRLMPASAGVNAGSNYVISADTPIGDILIDFGPDSSTMGSPWNNVTTLGAGQKISNLVYSNGLSSGYSLNFQRDFTGIDTAGFRSDLYPANAMQDSLVVTGSTVQVPLMVISNLPANRIYDYYQLANSTSSLTWCYFYLNTNVYLGLSQPESGVLPPHKALKVSPMANGTLQIDYRTTTTAYRGLVGLIHLVEYERFSDSIFTNATDLAGNARVYNSIVDIGAYEYSGNLTPRVLVTVPENGVPANSTVSVSAQAVDPDGSVTGYIWSWGDGSSTVLGSTGTNAQHTYSSPSTYVIQVTAQDNSGGEGIASAGITVLQPVPVAPVSLGVTTNAVNPYTSLQVNWSAPAVNPDGYLIQRKRIEGGAGELILDNSNPQVSASSAYALSTATAGYYGSNYLRTATSTGSAGIYYRPQFDEPGWYEVDIWYPASSVNSYATEVRVYHANGTDVFAVNQQEHGSQWYVLGEFYFERGPASSVYFLHMPSMAPYYTVADAVRFKKTSQYETVGTAAGNSTSFIDSGLLDESYYVYRAAASNSYGLSSWSGEASGSTLSSNTAPQVSINSLSPAGGLASLNVTVSGSASDSDGIAQYIWNFGDGYTGSLQYGPSKTSANYVYRYPGTYTVSLEVTDYAGKSSVVSTGITVYSQTEMSVSPAVLSYSWQQGEAAPAAQVLVVSNLLAGVLDYTLTADISWLDISPASGTIGAPSGKSHQLTLLTNGLSSGSFSGTVTVLSGDASNSPLTVPVSLTVSMPKLLPPGTGETAVIRFDLGPSGNVSTGAWNNITDPAAGSVSAPLDSEGREHTAISASVVLPFSLANTEGTVSPAPATGWPVTAVSDSFMGASAENTVIQWLGDYISDTASDTFPSPFQASVLDEATIRSPNTTSFNRTLAGGTFYANMLTVADNTINVSQVEDNSATNILAVQIRRDNTVGLIDGHGVFVWKKADFINGFDSVSPGVTHFSITASRNQWGTGSNVVRWVVKEGGQYYVSENSHTFVSHIYSNRTDSMSAITGWQAYDPASDLTFTPGSFAPMTFSNVTAVGFYVSMVRPDTTVSQILRMNVSEFSVAGRLGTGGGDSASLQLSGLNTNLQYALRFFASLTGTVANTETDYTVTHASGSETVSLNPVNNTGTVVQTSLLTPKADGTLDVTVQAGQSNVDPSGRYLLGVMELVFTNLVSSGSSSETFEQWISGYTGIGSADPDADPDGDGMTSYEEWIAGTHPDDSGSAVRILLNRGILNWNTVTGRQYTVYVTTNLLNASWQPMAEAVQLPEDRNQVTNSSQTSAGRLFFRLQVERP